MAAGYLARRLQHFPSNLRWQGNMGSHVSHFWILEIKVSRFTTAIDDYENRSVPFDAAGGVERVADRAF